MDEKIATADRIANAQCDEYTYIVHRTPYKSDTQTTMHRMRETYSFNFSPRTKCFWINFCFFFPFTFLFKSTFCQLYRELERKYGKRKRKRRTKRDKLISALVLHRLQIIIDVDAGSALLLLNYKVFRTEVLESGKIIYLSHNRIPFEKRPIAWYSAHTQIGAVFLFFFSCIYSAYLWFDARFNLILHVPRDCVAAELRV